MASPGALIPISTTMWDTKQHGRRLQQLRLQATDKVDATPQCTALHTLDQEKRKQIYIDMQNLVLADAPAMVSDFPKGIIGVNKRVKNRIPNGVAGSDRNYAYQWYVTDGK